MKRIAFGVMLALLLVDMLVLAFNWLNVKSEPKTWIVDDDGPADFHTIQEAINTANPGDTIRVYPGNYIENIVVNKSLNIFGSGSDVTVVMYNDSEYGQYIQDDVFNITSSHVNLTGFNIKGAFDGAGVFIADTASYVNIYDNKIESNDYGIYVFNSTNNIISGNLITLNNYPGIWLHSNGTKGNVINRNIITFCGTGVELENCEENTINDNSISYSYYGISLWLNSNNNIVFNNTVTNSSFGIPIQQSCCKNQIIANRIINSSEGLYITFGSNNNTVLGNSFISNNYGITIFRSMNNKIYHNNFINNTEQARISDSNNNCWDDGYPSGGNYWSDYSGVDLYGGPYQNITGSDGIGDTPYVIDANNTDRYPLMNPWTPIQRKFIVGDLVWTTADLHVRAGPGLSYSVIDNMIKGNKGMVLSGPVEADGYNWWYVNYSVGVVGWSAEDWIELAPAPPSLPQNFAYWSEAAINWAEQRLGSGKWSGYCLRFAANAFMQEEDKPAGWPSALDAARELYRFNQELGGWQHAPKGALIFFDKEGSNEDGHVGIYLGNGSIIHAYGTVRVETVEEAIAKPDVGRYLGWAYPPESWRPTELIFNVEWEGVNYPIAIQTNSTVLGFNFDQPSAALGFIIGGEAGTTGCCNITIPKSLIKGEPWTVKINGTTIDFQLTSNQTHSFIYFTYTFASTLEVTIEGTWVIPEFPSATILMLFLILVTLSIVIAKKTSKLKFNHQFL